MGKYLFGPKTMNAPWGLDSRQRLVTLACHFFNVSKVADSRAAIGNAPDGAAKMMPLTVTDFLTYLERTNAFPKTPNALYVARILEEMVSGGLLVSVGNAKASLAGLDNHYCYLPTDDKSHRGPFQLVPVLGPEFLHRLCTPGLVHISGTDKKGDFVSGTGLVIDNSHILTCRHVLSGMKVGERQQIQGAEYEVNPDSMHKHPELDVAFVGVDGSPLAPIPGLLLQPPAVGQTVYALGYPKLPGIRDACITMETGEVTNESVMTTVKDSDRKGRLDHLGPSSDKPQNLFLYSAISRPGNSGGPVMSEDGYLVGLSVADGVGKYSKDAFSPFYAGVPAQELVRAVKELDVGIELGLVSYE